MGDRPDRRDSAGVQLYDPGFILTVGMSKHLVDIDEAVLSAARAELGTATIEGTVNEALRIAAAGRGPRVAEALDVLAKADLVDRTETWR